MSFARSALFVTVPMLSLLAACGDPVSSTAQAPAGSTDVTHWKVHGPLGKTVEWDAHIVEDVENTRIAWATQGSTGLNVKTSGAVRFDDHGGSTGVEVSMSYDPPGGPLGELVAKLFADPQTKVERALAAFKDTMESTAPSSGPTVKHT